MNTSHLGRAILYARISEDDTGEAAGVQRQLEDGRNLASSRGWRVVAELSDNDISALKGAHRPGYAEVLRLVRAGAADYVVCWQTSRLVRNRRERNEVIELCREHGVAGVVAVRGLSFDLTTAQGRSQLAMMGEFDTMESEVKSERVIAAAAQRARNGRPSGALGYGWITEGTGAKATFRVHPEQGAVVAEIVDRLLARESLWAVTADLNKRGEPCPEQAEWAALDDAEQEARLARRRRPPATKWGKTTVKKIATRDSNAGIRVHRRGRPDEARYDGVWPALVDAEKHRRVVALLSESSRRNNAGTPEKPTLPGARVHLLSWGVGECGVCHGVLRHVTRNRPKYGKPISYYQCEVNGCVGRNADALDRAVKAFTLARLSEDDALDWLAGDEDEAKRLLARVTDLRRLIEEEADAYAADRIARPNDRTLRDTYRRIVDTYQRELDEAESALSRVNVMIDMSLIEALRGPEGARLWDSYAVSQRRAVLETLGVRVIVDPATRRGPGFDHESVRIGWQNAA